MRESLSSNHFSNDQQLADVVSYMEHHLPEKHVEFLARYPEWPKLGFIGTSSSLDYLPVTRDGIDYYEGDLDVEATCWMVDWIEANTEVYWEDGEPWIGNNDRTWNVTLTIVQSEDDDTPDQWSWDDLLGCTVTIHKCEEAQ